MRHPLMTLVARLEAAGSRCAEWATMDPANGTLVGEATSSVLARGLCGIRRRHEAADGQSGRLR